MIPSLYKPFINWSRNGSVWLISDPHFDDEDTKFMNPNWITPEEHIAKINSKVHKSDTLICLGDCGHLEWIAKIKAGRKILIKGNHDDKGNYYYEKKTMQKVYDADKINKKELSNKLNEEYPGYSFVINESYEYHAPFNRLVVTLTDNLFDEVYDGALFISDKILLSHEPVYGLKFCCNIHGHCHNGDQFYTDEFGGKHINIAADVVNWEVLSLGNLIKQGIVSDIPTIHRLVIDKR